MFPKGGDRINLHANDQRETYCETFAEHGACFCSTGLLGTCTAPIERDDTMREPRAPRPIEDAPEPGPLTPTDRPPNPSRRERTPRPPRKPVNLRDALTSLVAIVLVLALVILCAAGLWHLAVWAFSL